MCTAVTYTTKNHYFGRNLDLEYSYHETVTITPRHFPFNFVGGMHMEKHYAIIGMAYVCENYPLYYDATNEKGLSMAGLNFPGNAVYPKRKEPEKIAVTPYELIPWILGQCENLEQARELIEKTCLIHVDFNANLPLSPLHWMIADQNGSIVVEPLEKGLRIYDNPFGVMTNNPTFDRQLFNLNNYLHLTREPIQNTFGGELEVYSRGMGTMGLPGGLDSASRFVKAVFTKMNSISGESELESISQFYHILGSVDQQRGLVHLGENRYEITIYSSCCNMDKGIYYYKTYENSRITAVDMHHEDLDGRQLISYPLIQGQDVYYQNARQIAE